MIRKGNMIGKKLLNRSKKVASEQSNILERVMKELGIKTKPFTGQGCLKETKKNEFYFDKRGLSTCIDSFKKNIFSSKKDQRKTFKQVVDCK